MTRVTLIAALARNHVIGDRGEIPWRLPGEQARFKATTMGHVLIMGRVTFDSIGRALPGRRTIVVTRDPGWGAPGVETAPGLAEALALAGPVEEVFVAGGGQIYAEAIAMADRMILTLVPGEPEGDAFFPDWDQDVWHESDRAYGSGYDVVTYGRSGHAG
ncbi:MAG: dihydrofolate reductase [Dermatophilaceae bacterium]